MSSPNTHIYANLKDLIYDVYYDVTVLEKNESTKAARINAKKAILEGENIMKKLPKNSPSQQDLDEILCILIKIECCLKNCWDSDTCTPYCEIDELIIKCENLIEEHIINHQNELLEECIVQFTFNSEQKTPVKSALKSTNAAKKAAEQAAMQAAEQAAMQAAEQAAMQAAEQAAMQAAKEAAKKAAKKATQEWTVVKRKLPKSRQL